jgi:pimeloyl-ACP methyl ester carboxylesterase
VLLAYASGRVFGERVGSGPAWVLALHGWGRSHHDFDEVLAPARDDGAPLDAVALDLPGFGATPPPPAAWGSPEYASAVAAVLDEMPGPIVVVGHSLGGRVAVHLASLRPERIAGLVLVAAPLARLDEPRRAPRSYRAVRALARAGLVGEARLERARRRHGSADYRAATGMMRDVLVTVVAERYDDVLGSLSCPISLVWGELDDQTPVAVAEEIARLTGCGAPTVLAGVGHLVPTQAPAPLRSAIEALRPRTLCP